MAAETSAAGRVGWYFRRLRSMQRGELFWRFRQALPRHGAQSRPINILEWQHDWTDSLEGFRAGIGRPVLLDRGRALKIAEQEPGLVAQAVASAHDYADGRFQFFGYPPVTLEQPIDWHHDPMSGVRWPNSPSHRIDHRVAGGDVKWIWELNRLQHLPLLAQGWLFTGDNRYSGTAFAQIDTWIEQNSPRRGIAWRGAFEAGLRAISIAVAVQGLRDSPELTPERYRRIVAVLAESADRCWRERSLFSSANNHLIGEMAGQAIIAILFPDLPPSAQWERSAVQTLSTEANHLILPDGAGAEQSIGYQIATVELLGLVAGLLAQRDGRAPSAMTDAISRSSDFLAMLVGEHDPDPRYGDSDQEFAVRLGPEMERTIREHLAITAALGWYGGSPTDCVDTLTAQWYRSMDLQTAGSDRDKESDRHSADPPGDFVFDDGGLVVLRRGETRLTMDVGPLGYPSIAAHGHADSLAVTVSFAGEDLIGDPGTGSYYRDPKLRAVMRGTRAHPTVCVDGEDQSVIGGPFLWTRHARTQVRGVDLKAGVVDAEHDGYKRLAGRIIHRRWLVAPPQDRITLVVDLLTGNGSHEIRTSWPLHPSVDAQCFRNGHNLIRGGVPTAQILHAATTSTSFDDSFGDDQNALGWWSDRLESRTASWWLSAVCRSELPVVIATLISPMDGVDTTNLGVAFERDTITVTWREGVSSRTFTIRVDNAADVSLSPTHSVGD